VYDEAVREALGMLWEVSDRICGKRLKALVPILLPALETHGYLRLDENVRQRLLTVSASAIDQLFTSRRETSPHRRRSAHPRVAQRIPVSVITPKPASGDGILGQACRVMGAPAARTALEHVSVVEEPVEQR
jgi:hypothetical protein